MISHFFSHKLESHPWVVARFLLERGELRINAIKTFKSPEGMQRVVVTDYTPQYGRWHIVRKKITTTTVGYASPKIYLASPLTMSTQRTASRPR